MTDPTRGVIIAGNWKMHHTSSEAMSFLNQFQSQFQSTMSDTSKELCKSKKLAVKLFPSNVCLNEVNTFAKTTDFLEVGAQNAHWEPKGAFTGELSGAMLKDIGVSNVLVGHSERRQYFAETNETVGKKVLSLLDQGFEVMLCIGENQVQRESNQTEAVLKEQLEGALFQNKTQITPYLNGKLSIAYEPVWAIGTGLTATTEQAEEAHQFIRKLLWDCFGMEASGQTPILYGGSVKPNNISDLLKCPNVDGALVGGASLKPEDFLSLVQAGGKALESTL